MYEIIKSKKRYICMKTLRVKKIYLYENIV